MVHINDKGEEIIKIIDFGLMKHLESIDGKAITNVGSEYTKAPEVSKGKYGIHADLYSLGCILYTLLNGKHLFATANDKKNKPVEFKKELEVSEEMQDVIK